MLVPLGLLANRLAEEHFYSLSRKLDRKLNKKGTCFVSAGGKGGSPLWKGGCIFDCGERGAWQSIRHGTCTRDDCAGMGVRAKRYGRLGRAGALQKVETVPGLVAAAVDDLKVTSYRCAPPSMTTITPPFPEGRQSGLRLFLSSVWLPPLPSPACRLLPFQFVFCVPKQQQQPGAPSQKWLPPQALDRAAMHVLGQRAFAIAVPSPPGALSY